MATMGKFYVRIKANMKNIVSSNNINKLLFIKGMCI